MDLTKQRFYYTIDATLYSCSFNFSDTVTELSATFSDSATAAAVDTSINTAAYYNPFKYLSHTAVMHLHSALSHLPHPSPHSGTIMAGSPAAFKAAQAAGQVTTPQSVSSLAVTAPAGTSSAAQATIVYAIATTAMLGNPNRTQAGLGTIR